MAEKPAPFIPASPEETGLPPAFWRVFGTRSFFKLWIAQVVSSLGDWIGIIAILAIAARVSGGSGAAVSLVMVARVVPGFFLATVGGVIVDRFDRRRVMVACDFGRAGLLAVLPFVDSLSPTRSTRRSGTWSGPRSAPMRSAAHRATNAETRMAGGSCTRSAASARQDPRCANARRTGFDARRFTLTVIAGLPSARPS